MPEEYQKLIVLYADEEESWNCGANAERAARVI